MKTGTDVLEEEKRMDGIRAKIHEKFPHVNFPEPILEPLYYGRVKPEEVINRKLVLDAVSKTQFDIVSDAYKVVYHEDVLHRLLEALPEEYGEAKVSVNMYKDGARAKIQATFPELGDFKVNDSKIDPKVILRNSYDRSSNLIFEFGAVELICKNGMTAFVKRESSRAKHLEGAISKVQLQNTIQNSLSNFSDLHKIWIGWAEKELSMIQVMEVVEELPFTEKEREALLMLPLINHGGTTITTLNNSNTLWSINSAATQFVEHDIKSEIRKDEIELKIAKAISKAELKLAA